VAAGLVGDAAGGRAAIDHKDALVDARAGDIAPQKRAGGGVFRDLHAAGMQELCHNALDIAAHAPRRRAIGIERRAARQGRRLQELVLG
jgi:hypothetical protein